MIAVMPKNKIFIHTNGAKIIDIPINIQTWIHIFFLRSLAIVRVSK